MKKSRYVSEKRYPGVRKRSLGYVEGFGEDWVFSLNCRDKTQKVRSDVLGKASEGWTMQKAFFEKERILSGRMSEEETAFDTITLQDLFLDYSQFYAYERSHCICNYRGFSKLIPFFATKPVKDIRNRDMQDLRKKLERHITCRGTPYAPKTVGDIMKLVKMLIRHGVRRELCEPREDLLIDAPRFDNKVTEFLTPEQLNTYKKVLDEDQDKLGVAFIKVLMFTGMRPKAAKNLKWDDLDFENNRIRLRGETAKNKTTAFIPLNETLKEIFQAIPKHPHSEYVFTKKNGIPRNTFLKTAKRIKDKAGIPESYRPLYMLRHNFATQLASSGKVNLSILQALLTHKSPIMTQRYAHLIDSALQDASKVAEGILNQVV